MNIEEVISEEVIYEKKFPKWEMPSEEELAEIKVDNDEPKERLTLEQIMEKIYEGVEYVPMPERAKAANEFIRKAIEVSNLYEMDVKIEKRASHVSVTYYFSYGAGMKHLTDIIGMADDLAFFGRKDKEYDIVMSLDFCAINTLNKLRMFAIPLLNKQDIATITSLCNGLLLYSGLPEIAYIHTNMPIYAMVHSFKKLGELLAKNPELTNEFPILSLAPFDRIESLTTNDLFRTCIQSDNAFLIGVAIRLVAFLRLPYGLEIDYSCHRNLVDAMKLYIEYSVSYCIESSHASKGLLKDNSFAIRCAVKNINNYLTLSGIGLTTGNIHSIE